TYSKAIGTSDLLVAAIRLGNRSALASVSDNNGNAWQLIDRRADSGGGAGDDLELWYASNASSSPNARPTLTIRSTLPVTIRGVVAEDSGSLPSGALDQHATAVGTS